MKRIRLKEDIKKEDHKLVTPPGLIKWTARAAREWAFTTGEMPHMFLLRVSRGEMIDNHRPTMDERIDCAKACAQYFVPKLGSLAVKEDTEQVPTQQMVFNEDALESLTPDELATFEKVFGKLLGRGDSREGEDQKNKKPVKNYSRTLDLTAE